MLSLKKNVRVTGLSCEILLGIMVATEVYRELGATLTVTSVRDGKHMPGSKHYTGHAVDIRTMVLAEPNKKTARNRIAARLGDDYDVVLEVDHIHLEYDPRQKGQMI